MKHTITATITSLLSILFTLFHPTDDRVRGMSPGRPTSDPAPMRQGVRP